MPLKTKPIIYLAGGFRTNWQAAVRAALPGVQLLDPSTHSLAEPADYTRWDLDAIRKSDIILAYMEETNPGGYSLALEVGYAKALGKLIILIDKHTGEKRRRYFEMVRQVADHRFDSLNEALLFLQQSLLGPSPKWLENAQRHC